MSIGLKIVEGDFIINPNGSLDILTAAQKCSRDLGKFLTTEKENDNNITSYSRYNPTYGTEIDNQLLYNGLSKLAIQDMVTIKLNEALTYYIDLQSKRANLDLEEIITEINFDVFFDSTDVRKLLISIVYSTLYNSSVNAGQMSLTIG